MDRLRRFTYLAILAAVMLTQPVAQAAKPDMGAILGKAASDDIAAQRQAVLDTVRGSPEIIKQLIDKLVEPGAGDDALVRRVLHGAAAYVSRPGADAQRKTFNGALRAGLDGNRPAEVKCFLIRQLQITGGDESVPALGKCLTDEELAEPARQALVAIGSPTAVKALAGALPNSAGTARIGIIQALGRLGDRTSVLALIYEARSDDEIIGTAAIAALGLIGDARAEPTVAAALGVQSPSMRRAAFNTYVQLADRIAMKLQPLGTSAAARELRDKAVGMYARVLEDAADPGLRCAALGGLAWLGGPGVIDLIVPCVADPDATVRGEAAECLRKMPGKEVSAAIGGAFKTAEAPVRAGLLWLLSERSDVESSKLIAAAAEDPDAEVRVTAWYFQGKLEEPSMAMASDLLEVSRSASDSVRGFAQTAYLKLAAGLKDDKQRAIEMLQTIVSLDAPRDVREAAVKHLWDLGVKIDPAHERGFVTQWLLCGPFPGQDLDKVWPPEGGVDPSKPVTVGDKELKWFYHHPVDIEGGGAVNLREPIKPGEKVTAYMYAEITIAAACDAVLRVGSDDSVKVWLNGQAIHEFAGTRGVSVDQDTIPVRLLDGANKVMLKVTQGGGDWGACLRVTDEAGDPLEFDQMEW